MSARRASSCRHLTEGRESAECGGRGGSRALDAERGVKGKSHLGETSVSISEC